MRILHLSDTHLYGAPAARHYDRIDTAAALRGLLARCRDVPDLDAIIHTGDASDDGSAASYRLLHEILEPFAAAKDAELVIAMGNHDDSEVYGETIALGDRGTTVQDRVVPLPGGRRVVVLDTSVPGAGYGHLDPEQLVWLREVLAEPSAAGTVLALHHPPLAAATPLLRALELDGIDELAGVLEGSDVQVVLSGHYHHEMTGQIAGIPVHVVPGVTNVVDPVTAGEREQARALTGVSLVELGAGAPRVITSVLPHAGDTLADQDVPVYDFGPEQVTAIVQAAGR